MVERAFPRNPGSLDAMFTFADVFLEARGIDRAHAHDVHLVLEELFTNMVKYNHDGHHPVTIGLDVNATHVILRVSDREVEPFDPTLAAPVDVNAPLAARRPGGLGIHLVRRLTDDLSYDYTDRTSTITATIRIVS